MFRKLDLSPSSSEEVGGSYSVESVANINHRVGVPTPHLRTETDPVSETLCSVECRIMNKVQEPSNHECYTPSSEHFRIANKKLYINI
jgi:hypothetical protein